MKENKINVELIVPSLGQKYSLFIPVNKSIGEVIKILNTSLNELTGCFPISNNLCLFNVIENKIYDTTEEVKKSGIKNGTILALI